MKVEDVGGGPPTGRVGVVGEGRRGGVPGVVLGVDPVVVVGGGVAGEGRETAGGAPRGAWVGGAAIVRGRTERRGWGRC